MTRKVPKYEQIKNYLIQGIISRNFCDILPSENQLADKFSVSRMTARRALNELERQCRRTFHLYIVLRNAPLP